MSSTEAQRPDNATAAHPHEAVASGETAVDSRLESLLESVDRNAAAAKASLEEASAIAAENLAEKVAAGKAAAATPDLASQLDSLLENVDPAKDSDAPAPDEAGTDAATAQADHPATDLAGQLDALLDQGESAAATDASSEAASTVAASDSSATEQAPAETSPATTDEIAAALDALDGGAAEAAKAAPDAEHMTEEGSAAAHTADASPSDTSSEPLPTSEPPAPAADVRVAPNATPTAPAELTRVEADPTIVPPGPAPMLRVPPESAEPSPPKASLTRRVGTALMGPVQKFHAGANAVEATTLKVLSPLGRPMATAPRGVRLAIGGFALYSAALGVGAAYYAVFVRPTTFYQTRATPFSLKAGSLPAPTPADDAHGHAKNGDGHDGAAKQDAGGHGAAKSDGKAASKQPPKKKEAEKKSTAKKGSDKKGSDKKAEGGH